MSPTTPVVVPAGTSTTPDADVPPTPPSPTTIRLFDGVYTDRFGIAHRLDSDRSDRRPTDLEQMSRLAPLLAVQQGEPLTGVSQQGAPQPPPVQQHTLEKTGPAEPPLLARTVAEDTRPARVSEIP